MKVHKVTLSFGRLHIFGICMSMLLFTSLSINAQSVQTYKYRVTAYSAADNKVISQSNIVEVAPAMKLYLPNTFTPNGDGLNDEFGAIGEGIGAFTMRIYNKWGELVFESDDINKKWDGRFKGEMAGANVFVYQVVAKGVSGGAIYKDGTVTMVY